MTNTRITQGAKVIVSAGGHGPSRVTQAAKVIVLAVGQTPARITQAHKVILFQPAADPGPDPGGRRRNFMNFSP